MHSVLSKSQTLRANPALDRLGMLISFGCAIHCAAMPLIAGALALSGLHWLGDSRLEWAVIGRIAMWIASRAAPSGANSPSLGFSIVPPLVILNKDDEDTEEVRWEEIHLPKGVH